MYASLAAPCVCICVCCVVASSASGPPTMYVLCMHVVSLGNWGCVMEREHRNIYGTCHRVCCMLPKMLVETRGVEVLAQQLRRHKVWMDHHQGKAWMDVPASCASCC